MIQIYKYHFYIPLYCYCLSEVQTNNPVEVQQSLYYCVITTTAASTWRCIINSFNTFSEYMYKAHTFTYTETHLGRNT